MAMTSGQRFGAWLLPAYLAGVACIFLGERIVSATDWAHTTFSGIGALLLLGTTALRFSLTTKEQGERRAIAGRLAMFSLGTVIAMGCFFAMSEGGKRLFGVATAAPDARARFEAIATASGTALLLITALPLIFGEIALGPQRRAERLEARRVVAATYSGLTLAFAIVYCALFTYAAGELEWKADYSFFRTSRASESTKNVARTLNEPVKVYAFFPDLNEVGTEVLGYLREVAQASQNVQLEAHDRLMVPQLAKDQKVTQDGTIVLVRGNAREVLSLGAEMKTSAAKLKTLDADFQKSLIKVLREARTAYFTVGHGELNDATPDATNEGRTGKGLRKLLESQNYTLKDLGLTQGLGTEIPSDATMVIVLGPSKALLPEEIGALKRYFDKGGKVLAALDPEAKVDQAPAALAFGIAWDPTVLANDKTILRRRFNNSDRTILVTNRFSSHASVSTLSRNSGRAGLIFPGASSLEKKGAEELKTDFIVRAPEGTFGDVNGNFELDAQSGEKRGAFNLAAAVSRALPNDGKSKDPPECRAIVIGDADVLSDAALANDSNVLFALDAVRWLGGEESFSGQVASNEDVRIEHTKQKDELWFYGTILGAPSIVLGIGLAISRRRRKKAPAPSAPPKPVAKKKSSDDKAPTPSAKKAVEKKSDKKEGDDGDA
jgi:hypothetical protein